MFNPNTHDITFIKYVISAILVANITLSSLLFFKRNKIIETISWSFTTILFLAILYELIINLFWAKNSILSFNQFLFAIILNLLSFFLLVQHKSKFTSYIKTLYFVKTVILLTIFGTLPLLILFSLGFFAGLYFGFLIIVIAWVITGFLSYFYLKKIKQQGNFLSALINSSLLILFGYTAANLLLLPVHLIIKNLMDGMGSNMVHETNIVYILICLIVFLFILIIPSAIASFIYNSQNKNRI